MRKIYPLLAGTLIAVTSQASTQDSMLRPRVQLAQLKAEVDELLEVAQAPTIGQVKRTMKELQTKLDKLTAENTQLRGQLDTQKQEFTLIQQRNKQMNQSLKKLKAFKQKSSSHFEALHTLIDAVPDSLP